MSLVRMSVRPRWWLRYYLGAVVLGCWVTGLVPHEARVKRWIRRGLVVRVTPVVGRLAA